MTQLSRAIEVITAGLGGHASRVRTVRGNELHCTIARADVPVLAGRLRADFEAELILMVAEDRRIDQRAFFVHYLFGQ